MELLRKCTSCLCRSPLSHYWANAKSGKAKEYNCCLGCRTYQAKNYLERRNERCAYAAQRRILFRDDIRAKKKTYAAKNRPLMNAAAKRWKKANAGHFREWQRRNHVKLSANPQYRLSRCLRSRIWSSLKHRQIRKTESMRTLVGCSIDDLKAHLQKQFTTGMAWNNYGLWHVDHIRPCISFDLTRPEERAKCFHYSNLQPLWAAENIGKGGRWASKESEVL